VVLHKQQALAQPDALAFCQAQHGQGAVLAGGQPAVLAAAQQLVKDAQVRAHRIPNAP
jgi:hypothetical protein